MNKFFLILMLSTQVFAFDKVLYGEDSRRDWYELSTKEKMIARSVAVMMENSYLAQNEKTYSYEGKLPKLITRKRLCRDVRYWDQPVVGVCTGFLVGKDLLMTAGHCMDQIQDSCSKFSWVFSYNMVGEQSLLNELSADAVYRCKEVIKSKTTNRLDYALVKLDREVENRGALSLNKDGGIKKGDDVFTLGHPLGLPLKFADQAKVINKTSDNIFIATLDTFAGNSGSPVFNATTGKVEGVLVRGKADYVEDYDPKIGVCYNLNRCSDEGRDCAEPDGAEGESVIALDKIFEDLNLAEEK